LLALSGITRYEHGGIYGGITVGGDRGELLLELLGLELKFSEQRNPQSREDLEEVGNNMNFKGEL